MVGGEEEEDMGEEWRGEGKGCFLNWSDFFWGGGME